MGLVKQPLRKRIRAAEAAKMIGCSVDSLVRWGVIRLFKLNPDCKTSPWMCHEAEVRAYIERTER